MSCPNMNKKYQKNNKIKTTLIKIAYQETLYYFDKCYTKINDVLPREMANNYDVKLHIENPTFHGSSGSKKCEQFSKNNIQNKYNNNEIQTDNQHIIKINSLVKMDSNYKELLRSRKKVLGTKKLKNPSLLNFKFYQFHINQEGNNSNDSDNDLFAEKTKYNYKKYGVDNNFNTDSYPMNTTNSKPLSLYNMPEQPKFPGKHIKKPKKDIQVLFGKKLDEEEQQEVYLQKLRSIVSNIKILNQSKTELLPKNKTSVKENAILTLYENLIPQLSGADNIKYKSIIDQQTLKRPHQSCEEKTIFDVLKYEDVINKEDKEVNEDNKGNEEGKTNYKQEDNFKYDLVFSVFSDETNSFSHLQVNKSYSNSFYSNSHSSSIDGSRIND